MTIKIHPYLEDPDAVLLYQEPVAENPTHADFKRIGKRIMEITELELTGEKVAIKPNVTSGEHFADPDTGITTQPDFVGGMVEYLFQHGAKRGGIYVVEDPRDSNDFDPRHWKGTGYVEMAEETGAKLRCPVSYYCVNKTVPNPMVHATRNVTRYAVDPNTLLINVPKMKTHNLGITTLCLKNQMGLDDVFDRHYCGQAEGDVPQIPQVENQPIPHEKVVARHELVQAALGRRLADLAKVIKPGLCVVEGVIARDGTGFQRGRNYPLGMAIAGINLVAVDSFTSYVMGFDPQALAYLKVAHEAGLGNIDMAKLHVFVVENGKIVPCKDPAKLRTAQPFHVIRGCDPQ
jgi:uncharacterized protein (DUF362 family)